MEQLRLFKEKFKTKEQELRYYGSDLNKFVDENCRRDMTVINIDLAILDYNEKNEVRIIESKHNNEPLRKGQEILLKRLSKMGVKCYVVYGDYPFESVRVYSFQRDKTITLNKFQLVKFLQNESYAIQ